MQIGMLINILFLVNVAWLMTHELDAIQQHEWRYFLFLRSFDDITAYRIFTALHIPLFVWIFANLQSPVFWVGFDLFLIIHAGLHWILRHDPLLIGFNNHFSMLWIHGGALLAFLHLALLILLPVLL